MTGKAAALTGATGFLGRALCRALTDRGWRLRILARSGATPPSGAEMVVGRLADTDALERLAKGADLVIHVAGLVKARAPAGFLPVNVEGARRMAQATASKAPNAHFVLVSSLTARAPPLPAGTAIWSRSSRSTSRLSALRPRSSGAKLSARVASAMP